MREKEEMEDRTEREEKREISRSSSARTRVARAESSIIGREIRRDLLLSLFVCSSLEDNGGQ